MALFRKKISEKEVERVLQEEQDERKVWKVIEEFCNQIEEEDKRWHRN